MSKYLDNISTCSEDHMEIERELTYLASGYEITGNPAMYDRLIDMAMSIQKTRELMNAAVYEELHRGLDNAKKQTADVVTTMLNCILNDPEPSVDLSPKK